MCNRAKGGLIATTVNNQNRKEIAGIMSKFNNSLMNGTISFGDDFDSVSEVSHLLGLDIGRLPSSCKFNIPGLNDTKACILSENGGKGWHFVRDFGPAKDENGWNEIITITEFNDNPEKTRELIGEELEHPLTLCVFWKEERNGAKWLKFYGLFKIDADATSLTLNSGHPHAVYAKIGESVPCKKVEEKRQTFTNDQFRSLDGCTVQDNFMDDLAILDDSGKASKGEFKAWPGMRLEVIGVSNDCVHAKHGSKTLSIPRQDFALGNAEILPSPLGEFGHVELVSAR